MYDAVVMLICMFVSFVAEVLGVGCNLWIVWVNLRDWRRGVHLSLPDQILSFMALLNAVMQNLFCIDVSCLTIGYYDSFNPIRIKIICGFVFLVSCHIWFTAWLSVYYYMRIVSFSGGLLLALKTRISDLLPKLLVMSIAVSLIFALPSFWNIYPEIHQKNFGNATYNYTVEIRSIVITSPYLITSILGGTITLTLTLLSIGLTLCSLCRHVKTMSIAIGSSSRPQTQAHITAVRTMVLLVTVYSVYNVASLIVVMRSFNFQDYVVLCCWYVTLVYPTLQALVMITGNAKLKKATRGLLRSGGAQCSKLLVSPSIINNLSHQ
ncbi:hypothetical protein GDO81_021696 [Engystomops pustulosus]|uniref:Taste receptor type 2 n=1 Tax=Engystomops pustulosus TaxID=76066 RepID=A0AAV6Z936_ENGPU|nr:hypothetical protein GDO81_021696 [Engystomops pustulosus]